MLQGYLNKKVTLTRLAFVLILVMAISLFVGCTKANDKNVSDSKNAEKSLSGSLISEKPIEFTMLMSENAFSPFSSNWLILEEIKKRTNVILKIQTSSDADFKEKRKIIISSGEAPDIITNTNAADVSSYAVNGLILPISDYYSKMTNLSKKIKDWKLESDIADLNELDGKLYVLPGFLKDPLPGYSMAMRMDVLKKNNLAVPENYEQFFDVLKSLKQKYPDSIPLSEGFKGSQLLAFMSEAFETKAGQWALPNGYAYDAKTDKWYFPPSTEKYKSLITYMNRLYKEKLLDPEVFTQNNNLYNTKLIGGKVFAVTQNFKGIENTNKDGKKTTGNEFDLQFINPPANDAGVRHTSTGGRNKSGAVISASAANKPYFDKLVKFVDWFYYSDEGITLGNWGVEGITYKTVNGKKELVEDISNWNNPTAPKNLARDYGVALATFRFIFDSDYEAYVTKSDVTEMYQKLTKGNMVPKPDPLLKMSDVDSETESLMAASLRDYYNQMTMKFIFGDASIEKDWNTFVKECENKKSKELISLINKVWEKQKAKK